jgi:hypothetical protein
MREIRTYGSMGGGHRKVPSYLRKQRADKMNAKTTGGRIESNPMKLALQLVFSRVNKYFTNFVLHSIDFILFSKQRSLHEVWPFLQPKNGLFSF